MAITMVLNLISYRYGTYKYSCITRGHHPEKLDLCKLRIGECAGSGIWGLGPHALGSLFIVFICY